MLDEQFTQSLFKLKINYKLRELHKVTFRKIEDPIYFGLIINKGVCRIIISKLDTDKP